MTSTQLQVGLLVRGDDVPAWQARAVEQLLARTDAEVTHVVLNNESNEQGVGHYFQRLREKPLWAPVGAAHMLRGPPEYLRARQLSSIEGLGQPELVECEAEPAEGFGSLVPEEGVEALAETDVGVRFGFGFVKGDALTAPEHGVLSFHHGDLREYRGQPCGFWEFLHGESTAGVTLQRISETLDGGEIVAYEPVDIADAHTWGEIRRRLFATSEGMLATGVENVASGLEPQSPDELGDLYYIPEGGDVVKYVVKEGVGRVRNVVG
ncbi:formyltransferase family protein [Halorussus halophilus]|uniref:formyltransferase family protein n=1 Tax=Halorussus halophilus TaxID=2650975 RepID=UPI00130137EB|nr:formyltransferase family protein [Halorussus halophilus]